MGEGKFRHPVTPKPLNALSVLVYVFHGYNLAV